MFIYYFDNKISQTKYAYGYGIVATVDRVPVNNTTRVSATEKCSLGHCLVKNQQCCVPYRTDSDRKKIKRKQSHCPHLRHNAIHLTVSRISTQSGFSNILGNDTNMVTVCVPRKELRDPNEPEQLPSEWAVVTLSRSASSQLQSSCLALPCVFVSHFLCAILVGLGQRFIQQRWSGNPKLAGTIPFI